MFNKKNYMPIKINKLVKKVKDIKKLVRESTTYSKSRSRIYNGKAAKKWAIDNVNSPEDFEGHDCTNFISNALSFGGIPKDKVWYKNSDD